jgi:hypothetical protein
MGRFLRNVAAVHMRQLDTGKLEIFPAVYLWNHDAATSNITPAQDQLKNPAGPGRSEPVTDSVWGKVRPRRISSLLVADQRQQRCHAAVPFDRMP